MFTSSFARAVLGLALASATAVAQQLDVGMQYLNGDRTRYLAPGSITELPGVQLSVTPLESATHLVMVRFGARIGL